MRAPGPDRPDRSRFLSWTVLLALLLVGGLIVHDHLLPFLRRAPQAAPASIVGAGREAAVRTSVPADAQPVVTGAPHTTPFLTGEAARRALRQQQREAAPGILQHGNFEGGIPPAL